jgi:hypothetical protein
VGFRALEPSTRHSLDLENISKDIADLVKQLDKKVEGPVQVHALKNIEAKVQKIIKS